LSVAAASARISCAGLAAVAVAGAAVAIAAVPFAPAGVPVIAAIAGVVAGYDLRPLAEAATTSMLLLDCRKDWLLGWTMGGTLRAAKRLGVRVVTLPDGGHCADLDAPVAWREAVLGFVGATPALER